MHPLQIGQISRENGLRVLRKPPSSHPLHHDGVQLAINQTRMWKDIKRPAIHVTIPEHHQIRAGDYFLWGLHGKGGQVLTERL